MNSVSVSVSTLRLCKFSLGLGLDIETQRLLVSVSVSTLRLCKFSLGLSLDTETWRNLVSVSVSTLRLLKFSLGLGLDIETQIILVSVSTIKIWSRWSLAFSSPSKICKATIQASFLSGRYHTEALTRHWSTNKSGSCLLSSACQAQNLREDVRHILQFCPALQSVRKVTTSW